MKYFLPLAFLFITASAALANINAPISPEAKDDLERVESFRGIVWGTHMDSIYIGGEKIEFVKANKSDVPNAYVRKNDAMNIGSVKLSKVMYFFNDDGRFYKVMLEGNKNDVKEMQFIVDYKFGDHDNEKSVDGIDYKEWVVYDVTFTLADHEFLIFDVTIESDWEAAEAYQKNTSVSDF